MSGSPMRRALSSGGSSGAQSGSDLGYAPIWESDKDSRRRKTLHLSRFHLQVQQFLEPLRPVCELQCGGRRLRRQTGPSSKAGATCHQICDLESLNSSGPQLPCCEKAGKTTPPTEFGRRLINACKAGSTAQRWALTEGVYPCPSLPPGGQAHQR